MIGAVRMGYNWVKKKYHVERVKHWRVYQSRDAKVKKVSIPEGEYPSYNG